MPAGTAIAPSGGSSRTATATRDAESAPSSSRTPVTLRLRGEPRRPRRGIRWADDVVDNEGMGKKSSKVCCIYHGPQDGHEMSSDESSSSSSSSSSSDSESDTSHGRRGSDAVRSSGKKKQRSKRHVHNHDHNHHHQDNAESGDTTSARRGAAGTQRRALSPNAYERIPKVKSRRGGTQTVTEQAR